MKIVFLLCVLLSTTLAGCYYDVEEELYPSDCDLTNVTYQATVAPILSSYCLGCHSTAANLGSVRLEGYDAVKNYVNNGRLLGSIKHSPGFSPMPKDSPKIPSCAITQIERWIADGALNN
jgi:hypothetical protein